MTDLRKAAEMALVALDHTARSAVEQYVIEQQVVTFLKQALAQPEQEPINKMPTKLFGPNLEEILNAAGFYRQSEQKPKAWIYQGNLHIFDPTDWAEDEVTPLYTAPVSKPWVGLSDEQLDRLLASGEQIMEVGKTPNK